MPAASTPKLVLAVAVFVKSDKLDDLANLPSISVTRDSIEPVASANEAESSPNVSKAAPALPIKLSKLAWTYAVVAIFVESSAVEGVGAAVVPVNVGEVNIVVLLSFVTFPKPTSPAVVPWALNEAYVPVCEKASTSVMLVEEIDIVPPKVRLPEVVTVPESERPLTVPVPPTEVTVPVFVV